MKGFVSYQDERLCLTNPTAVPKADTYLWNDKMLCHITAQGFSQTQFMQPEPCFYSSAPLRAEKAAMAPEPQYFDHHPGRFFYVKDEDNGQCYSAPYRPMCNALDRFVFSPGMADVQWEAEKDGLLTRTRLALPFGDDITELWQVKVTNTSDRVRKVSLYPYFPVGFPSWMNTQGSYDREIGGLLCYTLTPYRKLEDYYRIQKLKDYTYLVCDKVQTSWLCSLSAFEGEGGLRMPDALKPETLPNLDSSYETTACIMQYRMELQPGQTETYRFLFGPANNREEIQRLKERYLVPGALDTAVETFEKFYQKNAGCIQVKTQDRDLDQYLNHWLPRQILYHAYTLRMVTDPQTRNHIQDAMSMVFIDPSKAKALYEIGIVQQKVNGEMPDGILLVEGATLKYTNQIPHMDHNVWWTFAVLTYMEETGDFDFLKARYAFADSAEAVTVYEHICRGLEWLAKYRSERGLCYIGQGDWNDPMNMVGYKGKGESVWLSQAMVYAMRLWTPICRRMKDQVRAEKFQDICQQVNDLMNSLCWTGKWYSRGYTDDGEAIGTEQNEEGKIFLNTQSFGILAGAPDEARQQTIMRSVRERLDTPYGLVMLAPSFTHMDEQVGRLSQKYPSTAENGSVYCHANAFYTYALLTIGQGHEAYNLLRKLLPGPTGEDMSRREHLPIYTPNYYRGNYLERVAGKASHLMNTGSLCWIYRCYVEGLFGLRGVENGLEVNPCAFAELDGAEVVRRFRGKKITVRYTLTDEGEPMSLTLNGHPIQGKLIRDEQLSADNELEVSLPRTKRA